MWKVFAFRVFNLRSIRTFFRESGSFVASYRPCFCLIHYLKLQRTSISVRQTRGDGYGGWVTMAIQPNVLIILVLYERQWSLGSLAHNIQDWKLNREATWAEENFWHRLFWIRASISNRNRNICRGLPRQSKDFEPTPNPGLENNWCNSLRFYYYV